MSSNIEPGAAVVQL